VEVRVGLNGRDDTLTYNRMQVELRSVIHFLYLKDFKTTDILLELEHVYGEASVTLRAVQQWVKAFQEGRTELNDLPRPGRPRDPTNIAKIRDLIQENPFLSQKKICQILGIHHQTARRIIEEDLQFRRINFRWIPHSLDSSQKASRVRVAKELLQMLEQSSDQTRRNIFTGDETWIYLDNPRNSMWGGADVERPTRIRRTIGAKKVMFWIDFSMRGRWTVVMLPPGQSFNSDFFKHEVIEQFVADQREKRPRMGARGLFLHMDNAPAHRVDECFMEHGITRLPHPPYSPDIAPCDFWLFGFLKNYLEGSSYDTPEQLYEAVCQFLREIPEVTLIKVYEEWICRLRMCIEGEGNYL